MSKKVGVVLSGCGFLDGAEIHEAPLPLLALDRAGVQTVAMAPSVPQMHVVDHTKSAPAEGDARDVLAESSRIARGDIVELNTVNADDLDALILPGGFGVAKNLSTFAVEGTGMTVNNELTELIRTMNGAKKPMGFICIAPAVAAKVLGELKPKLTIGNDADTANALEELGAHHVDCAVDDTVIDENLRIVSTPAYMVGPSIAHVAKGIDKLVNEVLEMTEA